MTVLDVREGYGRWAASYQGETAISYLETRLADALTPPLTGLRLLDAGCGVGRRLLDAGAASATGVDLSPEMLDAGLGRDVRRPGLTTMVGDVRSLPLPDRAFDVVWCRLVLGHLPDCAQAYRELGRVADVGARVVVTDFHPRAYAAGHRRTFRDQDGVHEVEHYVHEAETHIAAAREAGLILVSTREAAIGPGALPFYEAAGRTAAYAEHAGLPVVLAFAFAREA